MTRTMCSVALVCAVACADKTPDSAADPLTPSTSTSTDPGATDDCADPDDFGVPGLCEEVQQLPDWSDALPWHTGAKQAALTATSATLDPTWGLSKPVEVQSGEGYGLLVYSFTRDCSYSQVQTLFLVEVTVTLPELGVTLTDAEQIQFYDDPTEPWGVLWVHPDTTGTPWEGQELAVGVHYTAAGIDSVVGEVGECLVFRGGSSDPWPDDKPC